MTEIVQAAQPGQFVAVNPDGSLAPMAPKLSLGFKANIMVNGKPVPIETGDLPTASTGAAGLSFTLEPGQVVMLGNLEDLVNWLADEMNFDRLNWDSYPEALRKITSAVVTVTRLKVSASLEEVTFDIEVKMDFNWELIPDKGLILQSFTFRLAREAPPASPEALPAAA